MVAVELRVPPLLVWEMDPTDLATVVDVLQDRAKQAKKRPRRR